jgi:SpoVK/Ycf46/Vps4 family AAA+-type ATPase
MSTSTSTRPSTPELRFIKKEKIIIDMEINGLKDLIKLINENPLIENVEYNIDIETLHKIKKPLNELNNMIGMKLLKDNIIDQVIYYIQEFHKLGKCEGDFMHTVIYGPPGTGKTEVAKIIGRIFSKLGILNKGTFRKVTRSDLIAGYLGQTAIKTKEVINECLGGVLFIDEAYALGNSEKKDSFSKECIDTLCEALSDHKDNIMVIIAGYEKELKTCFFNYNDGLESRFTWRFKTDEYTGEELKEIFLKKVKEAGWKLAENTDIKDEWFKNNKDYFKYYGRDMETLFAKTKICHSRRVFLKSKEHKTKITMEDIENGFKLYLENGEVKSRKDNTWSSVKHMYN